jgi:hypothetical protein
MLPSAPGRVQDTTLAPVDFSTISAIIRNDISFPAPGPLGNITVTGLVGCQAQADVANSYKAREISSVRIRLL